MRLRFLRPDPDRRETSMKPRGREEALHILPRLVRPIRLLNDLIALQPYRFMKRGA
jgi:hypothetical protein